jgi:hypothetical protein
MATPRPATDTAPRFNPKATYVIGVLKASADPKFPDGSWSRKPVDKLGSYFTRRGCRLVDSYFEKNPDNLPSGVTHYIYERLPDGSLNYVKSGSFEPSTDAGTVGGLADEQRPYPPSYYNGAPAVPQIGTGVAGIQGLADALIKPLVDQQHEIMQMHERTIGQLVQQNAAIMEKYQGMATEYAQAIAGQKVRIRPSSPPSSATPLR